VFLLNTLIVPENVKEELRKPFGKTFSSIDEIEIPRGKKLITIGDVSSYNAISVGLQPHVIVFDGKERRKPVNPKIKETLDNYEAEYFVAKNPAGSITRELWDTVKKCFLLGLKSKIFVDGEEDLSFLPIAIECEDAIILYGNFVNGLVMVEVDEKLKNKCRELIKQMEGLG
jgi:uncharacterized protein (UPF0218 family)